MRNNPEISVLFNLNKNGMLHQRLYFYLTIPLFIFFILSCQDHEEIKIDQYQGQNLISSETAEMVALKFDSQGSDKGGKHKGVNKKIKEKKKFHSMNGNESFYVFNFEEGGYCIVSADNRMYPILAYSKNNYFNTDADNFPPNLELWIKSVYKSVDKLVNTNAQRHRISEKLWESYTNDLLYKEPVGGGCEEYDILKGPLLTTVWHQSCTFNDLLPILSCAPCGFALTGCVPTAMAQIMKYHGHPTSYNWSNMPDAIGTSDTQTLMKDIFDDVIDTYNCSATSVYTSSLSNVVSSFENDYNYDSSVTLSNYDRYDVVDEIIGNRPVFMTGSGSLGGHAWVIDGYRQTMICVDGYGFGYLKFHMNWGWKTTVINYNGWFNYNDFSPGIYTFNNDNKMIVGIKP